MFYCLFRLNAILAMLILPGSSALSPFRSERLLSQLKETDPAICGVSARYFHFIDAATALTDEDLSRLQAHRQTTP